jgi:hypothetical protein
VFPAHPNNPCGGDFRQRANHPITAPPGKILRFSLQNRVEIPILSPCTELLTAERAADTLPVSEKAVF